MVEDITALFNLLKDRPPLLYLVIGIILAVILFFCIFIVKRIKGGDEFSLGPVTLKPNQLIKEKDEKIKALEENFKKLNEDSQQKSHVIKLLNSINIETNQTLQSANYQEFKASVSQVYLYILYGIGQTLSNSKESSHRIAILTEKVEGFLMIHEGLGYSSEGIKNLKLDITRSAAGNVYRHGEYYHSGNVFTSGNSFKEHPEAKRKYFSLMCVPIKHDKMILGVLSIDGLEQNAFNKDDLDYLVYFANALSSLMFMEKEISELIREDEENDLNQLEESQNVAKQEEPA